MKTSSLKTQLLSFASLSALAFAATPALAQETGEEEELEEIVVTGLRASILNSIETKRNNSSIVEAISAEDIGKLPDASIGESLARLPGLAAQRFDGRANKISIRGLAPDFTTATLNGRELVSSDNNRAVEYDQFPSELITGATVYKTPDASLFAQAVGGTVDLQTARPLDYDEPVFAVGFRGEYSDQGALNAGTSAWGYRGNIAYIGQNEDGTIGYALGYARLVQPIQEQYIQTWGYTEQSDEETGLSGLFIDGAKPYVKSNELTRDGLLGVLQFRPSENWESRLDVMYSKFEDEQTLRGQEIAGYTAQSRSIFEVENGLVTRGSLNGLLTQARNDFSDRDVETFAAGFNTRYDIDENWTVEADLSYSKATREYSAFEVYTALDRGTSDVGRADYGYIIGGENGLVFDTPLDFSDGNAWQLGDNLGWGGPFCTEELGWQCASQDGFVNTESSSDELKALKLAVERQVNNGFIESLEFGARYAKREKDNARRGDFLSLFTLEDAQNGNAGGLVAVPDEYVLEPTSLDFIGLGDHFSIDSRRLVADGFYNFFPESTLAAARNNYVVEEDVLNAWVMANIDATAGDVGITGNVGVQAVYTDQSSTGFIGSNILSNEIITPFEAGDSYWEFLPSMNLSFHVSEDSVIRAGVARVMARPRMDQLRAGREYTLSDTGGGTLGTPWGGSGGNPELRPWLAWQFDLSYDLYFGEGGYASIAGFYKKLGNYVFDSAIEYDARPLLSPELQAAIDELDVPVENFTGFVTVPTNGQGGKIYGIELSASIPFAMLHEKLDGFGFIGSASFTDSSVRETPDAEPTELPGLSKTVINGTLYYEKGGFQARVSARHRSSFLAESFAIGLSREETRARAETVIDAQLSYDLDGIGYEGFTVYLQGSNLTNEPFRQFRNDDVNQSRNFHTYGRNFLFGFSYKM